MCFAEPMWTGGAHAFTVSRRRFLETGVAAGLTASAMDWGKRWLLPGVAEGAQTTPSGGGPGASGVKLTWFGTDGWEITFGNKTILLDPWFSRFDAGFFSGRPNPNFPIKVEEAVIDQHVKKADHILIGHGHWDHMADVPYIAKKTGAMVIGSETHANVLRASGVAEGKIVQVKGGELMQFDGYTIEVFPGLHSMGPTKKHAFPGHLYSVPSQPATIKDLPEGDSLIYLLTIGGKFSIFLMSTANFIERAIAGLKPDVALVASIFANQIHDFTPRLLRALNYPRYILPTHWDNFEKPYSEPPQDLRGLLGDPGNLDIWVKEAKQLSPNSNIMVLKFFESFTP
jgi:L-ascorbate metabolism protein UlaG (beta-lactamase superfamily)